MVIFHAQGWGRGDSTVKERNNIYCTTGIESTDASTGSTGLMKRLWTMLVSMFICGAMDGHVCGSAVRLCMHAPACIYADMSGGNHKSAEPENLLWSKQCLDKVCAPFGLLKQRFTHRTHKNAKISHLTLCWCTLLHISFLFIPSSCFHCLFLLNIFAKWTPTHQTHILHTQTTVCFDNQWTLNGRRLWIVSCQDGNNRLLLGFQLPPSDIND